MSFLNLTHSVRSTGVMPAFWAACIDLRDAARERHLLQQISIIVSGPLSVSPLILFVLGCHLYSINTHHGSELRIVAAIRNKLLLITRKHPRFSAVATGADSPVEEFQYIRVNQSLHEQREEQIIRWGEKNCVWIRKVQCLLLIVPGHKN